MTQTTNKKSTCPMQPYSIGLHWSVRALIGAHVGACVEACNIVARIGAPVRAHVRLVCLTLLNPNKQHKFWGLCLLCEGF